MGLSSKAYLFYLLLLQRLQYDAEEELRTTLRKTCGGRYTSKAQDNHSSPSERRRWRAYASTHQRWSESSRYYKWFYSKNYWWPGPYMQLWWNFCWVRSIFTFVKAKSVQQDGVNKVGESKVSWYLNQWHDKKTG